MLKQNKGVTLVALIITVTILLILASISIVSGTAAVSYIKFTNAKSQISTIQTNVNSWYQEAQNNTEILNYGQEVNATNCDSQKLQDTENHVGNLNQYRYFSADYLKNDFDIEGISYDFLIDIDNRSVILFGGITYEDINYFTAQEFGIKNVEYQDVSGNITFDTNIENGYIVVSNILMPENISKYDVQYQIDGTDYWTTLTLDYKYINDTNTECWYIPIQSAGTYNIKITTGSDKIFSNVNSENDISIATLKSTGSIVLGNVELQDTNGDSITIPANFNISSESPELVTEGMIIEDSDDNQYVWIPVFEKSSERDWGVDYSKLISKDDWEGIQTALKKYTNPDIDSGTYTYGNVNYTDVWYGDANYGKYGYYDEHGNLVYYTNGNMTKDEYDTLYQNMLKSVYKNGGFYIGRYEMGIEVVDSTAQAKTVARTSASKEYVASSNNSSNEAPTIEGMNNPISKANAVAYNYITQSQAQMLAERLNYSNITSSLMFGIQWETVCVFIEHYDTSNTKGSSWITNNTYSKEWGNYYNSSFTMYRGFYSTTYRSNPVGWKEKSTTAKGTSTIWLCTTGASDQNSCLNIYDFGGNLWEYTLERYDDSNIPDVRRGGAFDGNGYASERNSYGISYSNYAYSARVSLFVE